MLPFPRIRIEIKSEALDTDTHKHIYSRIYQCIYKEKHKSYLSQSISTKRTTPFPIQLTSWKKKYHKNLRISTLYLYAMYVVCAACWKQRNCFFSPAQAHTQQSSTASHTLYLCHYILKNSVRIALNILFYFFLYLNFHQIVTVELHRGWNSRLGFSLQCEPNNSSTTATPSTTTNGNNQNEKNTFISAIYNDSVAARDGRLKVGDQVLMVCVCLSSHLEYIFKSQIHFTHMIFLPKKNFSKKINRFLSDIL